MHPECGHTQTCRLRALDLEHRLVQDRDRTMYIWREHYAADSDWDPTVDYHTQLQQAADKAESLEEFVRQAHIGEVLLRAAELMGPPRVARGARATNVRVA
jgi:hypothetical protein